jgi:hypothetical protein
MEKRLLSLNTNKSAGPDGLPVWIFRDFAHILAAPLASIANESMRQGHMPDMWKLSDTVPLPKVTPPNSIETDLRPISITSVAAKVIEYFPVKFLNNSVERSLDKNQFGGLQGSSTAMALIKIVDFLARSTDDSSNTVRMLLCDFSKAFDLVDHSILLEKLHGLGAHETLIRWTANFLCNRSQRVKVGTCKSSELLMNAGCPQGTLLGPLAFVSYIDDLRPPDSFLSVKYIDDTTILHSSGQSSEGETLQDVIEYLSSWAQSNKMRFNVAKTKEIVFNFSRQNQTLPPRLVLGDNVVEQVTEAKILGVILRSDLKWNSHVSSIIKKANKRLYLLRLCKRAGVHTADLITIYTSLIRSVLEYCSAVWHTSLPQYLHDDIEKVQKRALTTIFGSADYNECLSRAKISTLFDRREQQCKKLFNCMTNDTHKLHDLLPSPRNLPHDLRHKKPYELVKAKTQRFYNSYVPYCTRHFQ